MHWLSLVFIAQFAWAMENYIDRHLLTRFKAHHEEHTGVGTLVLISAFFSLAISGVVAVTAVILTHYGVIETGPLALKTGERLTALFVGALEILWLIPYLHALNHSDETQAVPLFQMVPVFGLFLGLVFFGEIPTAMHVVAAGIILAGSVLLNTSWHEKKSGDDTNRLNMRVIVLMTLASFIIAIAALLFKDTALEENFLGTAAWMYLGSFFTGCILWLVVPAYRREFTAFLIRRDVHGFIINTVNEVIDNLSLLAFYGAVMLGPSTALVQSTVAYQPVFVLVIAMIAARLGSSFHTERLSGKGIWHRVVGITIIVFGSFLIFV